MITAGDVYAAGLKIGRIMRTNAPATTTRRVLEVITELEAAARQQDATALDLLRRLVAKQPADGEYGSCAYCGENDNTPIEGEPGHFWGTFNFPKPGGHKPDCPYGQAVQFLA